MGLTVVAHSVALHWPSHSHRFYSTQKASSLFRIFHSFRPFYLLSRIINKKKHTGNMFYLLCLCFSCIKGSQITCWSNIPQHYTFYLHEVRPQWSLIDSEDTTSVLPPISCSAFSSTFIVPLCPLNVLWLFKLLFFFFLFFFANPCTYYSYSLSIPNLRTHEIN